MRWKDNDETDNASEIWYVLKVSEIGETSEVGENVEWEYFIKQMELVSSVKGEEKVKWTTKLNDSNNRKNKPW